LFEVLSRRLDLSWCLLDLVTASGGTTACCGGTIACSPRTGHRAHDPAARWLQSKCRSPR